MVFLMDRADVFELRNRILRLETLYDAARALPYRRTPREIVTEVLERGVALLDAAWGAAVLLAPNGDVEVAASAGRSFPGQGAIRWADQPFLARILSGSEAVASGPTPLAGRSVRSILGVPLRGSKELYGAILLVDKERRGESGEPLFDDEDGRFLGALAALGALAIESTRRFERLEDDRRRLIEENRELKGRVASVAGAELIGSAPAFRQAVDLARRVAPSRVGLLLRGESGTGKELVARLVHFESDRAAGPFVAINCSAIPETLLEAELFGIERGVATGVEARPGRIELAAGGTLFLDEIGDMPSVLQAKLLRVIAEREIERVGGRRRIPVDVRFVAATHRPLEQMVAEGKFREDLFYRLRVVEIVLPPLRKRREDIPLLLRHFVRKAATEACVPEPVFGKDALAALLGYDFPGNVRELENVVAGCVALRPGAEIGLEEIALISPGLGGTGRRPEALAGGRSSSSVLPLREAEREHALEVLRLAEGNKSRAARLLGIDRKTLDRLVGKKGADVPEILTN
jgi:Nif-specific regulatory protein